MPSPLLARLIEQSAAPPATALALERLAEPHPDLAARIEDDHRLGEALAAVASASRALTELCLSEPTALDVLADLERRPEPAVGDVDALRRWKRLELLRIAARDLLGLDDLGAVGRALAAMADDVLDAACRLGEAVGLADEHAEWRKVHQPRKPCAGSVFKNPEGTYAGLLIEEAGLKGYRVGGAQISPQHANFIVNVGGATGGDVLALIREARRVVREARGIALETEVEFIGDWANGECGVRNAE